MASTGFPRPRKSLGQHFLTDPGLLARIVDAGEVTQKDTVVEVGPGRGDLTVALARAAGRVIAVEVDERLREPLTRRLREYPNVTLRFEDGLRFPYESLPRPVKVVSNPPYYLATPLLLRLLEAREVVTRIVLTLQKEVAQRVVAAPGSKAYGVLSLAVQLYAEPAIAFAIPRGAFHPRPQVDSAVVVMRVHARPRVPVQDEGFFFKVVRTAFAQRRKTLRNALRAAFPLSVLEETLEASAVDGARRAETLSLEEFQRLAACLARVSRG